MNAFLLEIADKGRLARICELIALLLGGSVVSGIISGAQTIQRMFWLFVIPNKQACEAG